MSKSHSSSRSKISRLRAQTKAIRWVNGMALCLFALAIGTLAVASALPQKRKLAAKKHELQQILDAELEVLAEKDDAGATYDALRNDPEYLELHAIDRLNLYRNGESIYRIERDR